LRKDLPILGQHIGKFDCRLLRVAVAVEEGQEKLYSACVAAQGVVDQPAQHPFNRGDTPSFAIFRNSDFLPNHLLQDRPDRSRSFGTAAFIATSPRLEPMGLWRVTVPDLAPYGPVISHFWLHAICALDVLLGEMQ
jgi:hypothetical protein